MSPRGRPGAVALVLLALFLSGVASVVNQVVWQRALKVFLGGSETISSMVVVLVFMLGLGIGAGVMGARIGSSAHPLRTFAALELTLALVNVARRGDSGSENHATGDRRNPDRSVSLVKLRAAQRGTSATLKWAVRLRKGKSRTFPSRSTTPEWAARR